MLSSATLERYRLRRFSLSREWVAAFALALGLSLLVTMPYVLGYLFAHPGTYFTGILMRPDDGNSYLAKMQEGYAGQWLYTIPYTSEPHSPAFVGGYYLFLGRLARQAGLSVLQMWHLARFASALVLFLVTFGFVGHFLKDRNSRWIAYLFALTGSGLGWLLAVTRQMNWLGSYPVDFGMPEAHLFFTALTFPHFATGTALIIISIWWSIRALESERVSLGVATGIVNVALVIVYPFLIYLTAAVLALNWLRLSLESRRLRLRAGLIAGATLLLPAPLLLYYLFVLKTNTVFSVWDAQAVTPSPHPFHYVVAYGMMLALAAPTLREREFRGLWLWALAAAMLVYVPLNTQRRFVEGVQAPLAVLAAGGLTVWYQQRFRDSVLFSKLTGLLNFSSVRLERFALTTLLSVVALSNIYVLGNTTLASVFTQPYPNFIPKADVRAVDWAGENLPRGAVILGAYETGMFIPTRTDLRTVIGHWAETVDFLNKYYEVKRFFGSGATLEWRDAFLNAQRVDYVFYGPTERALGTFDIGSMPGLESVYSDSGVAIYHVVGR